LCPLPGYRLVDWSRSAVDPYQIGCADNQQNNLAVHVGADLSVMDRDATKRRAGRPFVFSALRHDEGVEDIAELAVKIGGLSDQNF